MKSINRLTVFIKRIMSSRLYISLLAILLMLSLVYQFLPEKNKTADIKVALCFEEDNTYNDRLIYNLQTSNSLYEFYVAKSLDALKDDVESKKAECGFFIPAGFYENYINGYVDTTPILEYTTNATTLGATIAESVFSQIFKVCSADILCFAVGMPELNDELIERLNGYLDTDAVFQIEDHSNGTYISEDTSKEIKLPVFEVASLMLIFSGLLGLLMFIRDSEKNIYVCLTKNELRSIKLFNITGALIPLFILALICVMFTYREVSYCISLTLYSITTVLLCFFPGCMIKKSSTLTKILPVIMLILTVLIFVFNVI